MSTDTRDVCTSAQRNKASRRVASRRVALMLVAAAASADACYAGDVVAFTLGRTAPRPAPSSLPPRVSSARRSRLNGWAWAACACVYWFVRPVGRHIRFDSNYRSREREHARATDGHRSISVVVVVAAVHLVYTDHNLSFWHVTVIAVASSATFAFHVSYCRVDARTANLPLPADGSPWHVYWDL